MTTAFTFVSSPAHEYPEHPESPGRLDLLAAQLDTVPAQRLDPVPATAEQVALVHDRQFIAAIAHACREQAPAIIDMAPTFITPTSYADALLAAGATLRCLQAVQAGEVANAFAIVRPPGHHAEPERAMGFCIFNNIAIAARQALEAGLQRVLIVDFDAHHGNGTQAAFMHDDRVAFLSTHQWGIYPGSGRISDAPHARQRIVNVPLPPRAGDTCFARIQQDLIRPLFQAFRPQLLLVSAGFDAHWDEPITGLGLSISGFFNLSKGLLQLASEFCQGRALFVLEGGYNPGNVAGGAGAVFSALTGNLPAPDSIGPSPYRQPDIEALLAEIREWHGFR